MWEEGGWEWDGGIPEDQIVGLGELVQGRVAHDRRRVFLFWQL